MREASASLDGRIELKGLLGAGAMGEVHRAWDHGLERAVAVKFFLGAQPREAERLLLEGQLQARVDHPNVVRVLDAGTLGGRACLVLQLVEGRSLEARAASLSLEQRVELVRQAAQGVHAAHLQGLVHRDVKPGNVLVEEGPGEPQGLVSDFGLARGEEPGLTRSGLAPGTLAFMSPEQLLGGGPVGFATDIYGLGATLYAVLAGHPPHFATPAATAPRGEATDLVRRILETPAAPLPREVPAPLARVVAKAMEKRAGSRYESAEAFAADLWRFQRGEPVTARPASWAERAVAWRRRDPTFARALSAAAAALLLSLGWGVSSTRRADLEALDAARLGALGESMEAALRMEYLSPAHDLRPALARVRAQVEALRPEAARGGGPASFALGKGLELLGDVDGARAAYEGAWAKGFRTPRVAEGLGHTLGEQYRREYQRAQERLEPKAREERQRELQVQLRDPAIRALRQGGAGGWSGPFLEGSIALLEGRFAQARAAAARSLAENHGRYEARVLEGEAWYREARKLWETDHGKFEEALTAIDHAAEALEAATETGRSDPVLMALIAEAQSYGAQTLQRQGRDPTARADWALAWVERAARLNPDSAALVLAQADSLEAKGLYLDLTNAHRAASALYEKATPLFRRALALEPNGVRARCELAYNLYTRAGDAEGPRTALSFIEEGLRVAQEAIALAPKDTLGLYDGMLLSYHEAKYRQKLQLDPAAALARAIHYGEELLPLTEQAGEDTTAPRVILGRVYHSLAQEQWAHGGDPGPNLVRSVDTIEHAQSRDDPHRKWALIEVLLESIELRVQTGEDVGPLIARSLTATREAIAARPDLLRANGYQAFALGYEDRGRMNLGEDAAAALAELEATLKVAGLEDDANAAQMAAEAPLLAASLDAIHGRDPQGRLVEAERRTSALLRADPEDRQAIARAARCAVERAAWLRRQGAPTSTSAARNGLRPVEQALGRYPRAPDLWILKAHLEALAGEGELSRQSLDSAFAIQPLVRGGHDAKKVLAELGP